MISRSSHTPLGLTEEVLHSEFETTRQAVRERYVIKCKKCNDQHGKRVNGVWVVCKNCWPQETKQAKEKRYLGDRF